MKGNPAVFIRQVKPTMDRFRLTLEKCVPIMKMKIIFNMESIPSLGTTFTAYRYGDCGCGRKEKQEPRSDHGNLLPVREASDCRGTGQKSPRPEPGHRPGHDLPDAQAPREARVCQGTRFRRRSEALRDQPDVSP